MSAIKLTQNSYNNVLTDMKNNTGTSRTDDYYFATAEINLKDLRDLAFKKNVLLTLVTQDDYTTKANFLLLLS